MTSLLSGFERVVAIIGYATLLWFAVVFVLFFLSKRRGWRWRPFGPYLLISFNRKAFEKIYQMRVLSESMSLVQVVAKACAHYEFMLLFVQKNQGSSIILRTKDGKDRLYDLD